ncbi:MAG: 30S ribosomal protein S12 methylthiotransferase RimO, partial [Bacteroidales bacterium]
YVGRTEYDSPEVDDEVLIPLEEKGLKIGAFYSVKITEAEAHDLYATTSVQ